MRAGAPFGEARDRHLAGLDGRDRRLAYELAAGVLRRQAPLDRTLELRRADDRLHDILRLGAYQLRFLSRVPPHAAVGTSVELARDMAGEGAARYVNQALRRLAGEGGRGRGDGAATTHPRWLVERWRTRFGAAGTARLVAWNDTKPALVLQPARWDHQRLRDHLRAVGIGVEDAPFGAGLLVARHPPSPLPRLSSLPGYAEGGFIVQDPAQALVCRFAALPPGSLVYDACAAPGGKAVALERLGPRVLAGDARPARLGRLADTARRAGVAIRIVCADLLAAPVAPGTVDAVLVDAPCTATGTMARHPDGRWRLRPRTIAQAAARQRRLLDAAAGCVRPNGWVVYATCSLEAEENDAIVNDFLARHPAFARDPARGAVPDELLTAAGDFFTVPPRHGVDGAYAARLVRRR